MIPARGGSKRVYKKNIKLLGNKPLIQWSIEEAKKASSLDAFLVSTDDDEIAEISRNAGAPVPFKRPSELSEDRDGKEIDTSYVLRHALEWCEKIERKQVSHIVCLQPTSPFKTSNDIDACVQIAKVTNAETVVSIAKTRQSPFWMFEVNPVTQQLYSFMDVPMVGDNLVSQNLPLVYYPNGAVYVTRRDIIMDGRIYGKKIYGYTMPYERSIDLEDENDFYVASALLPIIQKHEPWTQLSWIVS